ncbi:MAG: ABC transporter ATP-binding protein [Anaerolineaceae bacterium]|jgi:ABC-2 type transport system ATP-binding protein|nr:ABC transporter ATP-binding protein [Anaerolineaceae bacterium]|tara:strand:- start:4557 stop:5552 length:996 start_codon:yes stop_codon:yes gene_type:complete
MYSIKVEQLVRHFGKNVAVDDISFKVESGEIFGFLGPNGAGKTTTINMLTTLLRPTSGTALVNGYDVGKQQALVRQSIGMIFQDASLDDKLTGRENLLFHGMLYGLSADDFSDKAAKLLDMVELTDRAEEVVLNYSGGMKRRLEIVRGLLHNPNILFLDEPTLGLDPQTRRHIWDYLITLRERQGVTMFMTTHYMEEAEHCDHIAIIDDGKIVGLDTPEALKAMVGGDIIMAITDDNEQASLRLQNSHGVDTRKGPDNQLIIETERGDRFIPEMMSVLTDQTQGNISVKSVYLRCPTLEDVFIKLTGHAMRDQNAVDKDKVRSGMRRWRGR